MWVTQGTIVCGTMPDGTPFIVLGTDPEPKTGLAVEGVREYSDETEEQSKRVFNNLWSVTDC